jgi:hypothetical protein
VAPRFWHRVSGEGRKAHSYRELRIPWHRIHVVRDTRITVETILEGLTAGESIDDILNARPRLTREGVLAAIAFATRALRADVLYPTPDRAT